MVICLERGADFHTAQLMPLPFTVSCFSEIQIGFAFLVPAHPSSPGKRADKRVCVCVYFCCLFFAASRSESGSINAPATFLFFLEILSTLPLYLLCTVTRIRSLVVSEPAMTGGFVCAVVDSASQGGLVGARRTRDPCAGR